MKYSSIIFYLFFLFLDAKSQSGSYILSRYTANAYWNESTFPPPSNGTAFSYQKSDTLSAEWNNFILSKFKYSPSIYYNHCIDSIKPIQTFTNDDSLNTTFNQYFLINPNYGFKQLDPIQYYSFSLNNIIDTAYTTFTPKTGSPSSSDTEICFFIVPGSGDNQTAAIVRNEGYHNSNCNVMNTLKKHGDIYVFIKPNEDNRALQIKQLPAKKMVTDLYPIDSYLNQFLISNNKHEGINYLIECVAAIKDLKKKYKKVFILGCSQGGYSGLYAALESEVDGVLISSGYSVKLDDNYLQFGNMAQKFAQLPFLLAKDSVKKNIRNQKTNYYFSWPTNDSPIYQAENNLHHTQNYFSLANPLTNVKYLYTYNNHAFPPCIYIDSFVKEVKYKPKAFVTDTLIQCVYDSLVRKIEFIGQGPFTYDIYKNDSLLVSATSLSNTSSITLIEEGKYQIKNIVGANGLSGIWSDKFSFTKNPKAEFSILSSQFNCDSLFTKVELKLKGTPPFELNLFTKDASGTLSLQNSLMSNDSLISLSLLNSNYVFKMTDAIACEVLSDSIRISDSAINFQLASQQYNCLQNQTDIVFNLSGRSPFTIYYFENGLPQSIIQNTNQLLWHVQNGNYFITNMIDSNNCNYTINQLYNIQNDSLIVHVSSPNFDCITNQESFDFELDGNSPFQFNYLKDGLPQNSVLNNDTTLIFNNGIYDFENIIDATGCQFNFTTPIYHFANDTFKATFIAPIYDCDSNKSKIHFDLEGNPPFTIFYQKDLTNLQVSTSFNTFELYLENGNYLIQKMMDSKGCVKDTNQLYSFNFQPLSINIMSEQYNCDSNLYEVNYQFTGDLPWILTYKNINTGNITSINSVNPYLTLKLSNGDYEIISIEDDKCLLPMNDTMNIHFLPLQSSLSPATIICDSDKYSVQLIIEGGIKPYTFTYNYNGLLQSFTTYSDTNLIVLENGNYQFNEVTDSLACTKQFNQFMNIDYTGFQFNSLTQKYICEKDSTEITFDISHVSPLSVIYNNGIFADTLLIDTNHVFNFPNGNYHFIAVYDTVGCIDTIDKKILIENQPLNYSPITYTRNCDSRDFTYQFNLEGKSPWTLFYNANNMYDTLEIASSPFSWTQPFGQYYFINLKDANECELFIGHTDSLHDFLPFIPLLQDIDNKLVTLTLGERYDWYINGNVIDSTSGNSITIKEPGEYQVAIYDKEGCVYFSNKILVTFPEALNIFPNPTQSTTTVLVNEPYGLFWEYLLIDMQGNKILSGVETSSSKVLNLQNLANGLYNLVVRYENGSSKHILRIIKY